MLNKEQLIHQATQRGILPANYSVSEQENPSWAILLLSFIGAQFVVWPLVGFLGALIAGLNLLKPPYSFILSMAALGAGVWVLRKPKQGVFVEQLAFNMLILGLALWAFSLFQWVHNDWVWGLLGASLIGTAAIIPTHWVQAILSAIAAPIFMKMAGYGASLWLYFFVPSCVWAWWCLLETHYSERSWSRTAHWISNGTVVGVLLYMALSEASVLRFVFGGGAAGSADTAQAGLAQLFALDVWDIASGLATMASAALVWYQWQRVTPRNQIIWWVVLYAVCMVLALVVPNLGILVLLLSVALLTGRRRIVVLSIAVMLVQLSVFYYALQWTLLDKAVLLIGLGACMLLALLVIHRRVKRTSSSNQAHKSTTQAASPALAKVLLALGLLLALGITQYDVYKKENIIAHGQRIYVALQPVDPRSLMQGDYMALRFALPDNVLSKVQHNQSKLSSKAFVAATLDARGVATVQRLAHKHDTLGKDEILLPIKKLKGRWVLVTDAYFFPEGKGRVFTAARFGELRALGKGRVLLVGLADENLHTLQPKPDVTKAQLNNTP